MVPTVTFANLPEEKRQQLIDIALEEFATKPYEQASITNIVKLAGIAKGSIYQYFENKKDLYFHLFDVVTQAKIAFVREHAKPVASGDFFDSFKQQMLIGASFNLANPLFMNLLTRMETGPFADEVHTKMRAASNEYMINLVKQEQASGNLRNDIEPSLMSYFLLAMAGGLADYVAALTGIPQTDWYKDDNLKAIQAVNLEQIISGLVEMMRSATSPQ